MSAGYIEFDSIEAFNLWHEDVNAILGYPDPATKTERYTALFRGADDKLYAQIDDNCPPQALDGFTLIAPDKVEIVEAVA